MSTETDIYGLTWDEQEAFEEHFDDPKWVNQFAILRDRYEADLTHERATAWAACAKLYRRRIKDLESLDLETLERENIAWYRRVKELEAEVRRQGLLLATASCTAAGQDKRVRELEAELTRLRGQRGQDASQA